jgi:hypothetical protein
MRDPGDGHYPWAETELAFALRWTRTAAGVRLEQARRMIEDLPALHAALSAGRIDVPKALLIGDQVGMLRPEVARRLVDQVLEKAPEQTTGQLRARLSESIKSPAVRSRPPCLQHGLVRSPAMVTGMVLGGPLVAMFVVPGQASHEFLLVALLDLNEEPGGC